VRPEFSAVPKEDKKKVDFALFLKPNAPAVFIEAKKVGHVAENLEKTEEQLRNYNRDMSAEFCVITDGANWRLYYEHTAGTFSSKFFKNINIGSDKIEDVERSFFMFLSKINMKNGKAAKNARAFLKSMRRQNAMEELLPKAKRLTEESPYPSQPEALVKLMKKDGHEISRKEAEDFIKSAPGRSLKDIPQVPSMKPEVQKERPLPESKAIQLPPEPPDSLAFTSIDLGEFGAENAKSWNELVRVGLKLAVQGGYVIDRLQKYLTAQVKEGDVAGKGFHPVPGTSIFFQNMNADTAWKNALALAKQLKCEIKVKFHWRNQDAAAHPGENGVLHWSP